MDFTKTASHEDKQNKIVTRNSPSHKSKLSDTNGQTNQTVSVYECKDPTERMHPQKYRLRKTERERDRMSRRKVKQGGVWMSGCAYGMY